MAKQLADKPIEVADLSEYLKSEDDFAFELEILRYCLAGAGFKVEHGGSYRDPVTRKDRQFDIRLMAQKERSVVKLAIECKNLKSNFPLLVSRIPRRSEENVHDIVISLRSSPGNPLVGKAVRKITATGTGVIFEAKKFVGKSTAQVGRSKAGEIVTGDSEIYEKWSQALGSAFDLVASSARDYTIVNDNAAATVIFPVLVIPDGTLWTIDYTEDGNQLGDPRQSKECEIFLGKRIDADILDYTASHLLIFTKTEFNSYLDRLATNDKYWERLFPSPVLEQLPRERAGKS
jgi:hypothetical protein